MHRYAQVQDCSACQRPHDVCVMYALHHALISSGPSTHHPTLVSPWPLLVVGYIVVSRAPEEWRGERHVFGARLPRTCYDIRHTYI